jgi:hypothetical protein
MLTIAFRLFNEVWSNTKVMSLHFGSVIGLRPANRAFPVKASMPFSAYVLSRFFGTGSVNVRLKAMRSGQSIYSSPATPFSRIRLAASTTSVQLTSIFLGSHPRSVHVPPNGRKSMTATVQPTIRTRVAVTIAAVPVPTIIRSNVLPFYIRNLRRVAARVELSGGREN